LNPLFEMRTNAGLNQKQLAEKANVDKSLISKLENNRTKTTLPTLVKLAQVCNRPVEELIDLAKKVNSLLLMRAKAGLSQQELAAKADVDISVISELENDKAKAYPSTLGKLAKACNDDIKDLLKLASSPETLQTRGRRANQARQKRAKKEEVAVNQ
jgi:transcriptional regulator with XRE-family HTH domain